VSVDRVIHSARLVGGGAVVDASWAAFDAGSVIATGTGDGWRTLAPREAIDAAGSYLSPGFIDIHGHGGGGYSYDEGADAVAGARAMHRAHGTTGAVISLVTASVTDLASRAGTVAELAASDRTILGSHLEGPFLAVSHKGAHDPALLRDADPEVLAMLIEAGRGTVRQITLAPERPGGMDAVRRTVAAGIVAAVGHTGADLDVARAAFDAGATVLTHAFNAMRGIHHRAPGPVVAALEDSRVTLEVIADGIHVHPSVLRLAADAAPGRIALVTDAMAAAGAPEGRYALGGRDVVVSDAVARLASDGTIAGSTLTQDAAVRRMVHEAGMSIPDAVDAVTRVPARALGRRDLGTLEVGSPADAVLLSADLDVQAVWVGGIRVLG
jgi:N-acetylglucosamine-6-phosphate deacetylase